MLIDKYLIKVYKKGTTKKFVLNFKINFILAKDKYKQIYRDMVRKNEAQEKSDKIFK